VSIILPQSFRDSGRGAAFSRRECIAYPLDPRRLDALEQDDVEPARRLFRPGEVSAARWRLILACLRLSTLYAAPPKVEEWRNLTSAKTRVSRSRRMRSISPQRHR